ncbi:MAG TPA: hypothetical protein VLJ37_12280 [bacterium]|nr:hypothetical protein [bacterium]
MRQPCPGPSEERPMLTLPPAALMARPPILLLPETAATVSAPVSGPSSSTLGPSPGSSGPPDRALAAIRLNYLLDRSERDGSAGSYAGWLTRVAWEEMGRRRDFRQAPALLHAIGSGAALDDYECLVAEVLGKRPLATWPCYEPAFLRLRRSEYSRVRALPMGWREKCIAARAADALRAEGGIPPDEFLDVLERAVRDPGLVPALEKALKVAAASPLAMIRFHRLYLLLRDRDGLLDSKLGELGDEHFRLAGVYPHPAPVLDRFHANQSDAYLGHPSAGPLIDEVEEKGPEWIEEGESAARAERRRAILRRLLRDRPLPGALCVQDVVCAFRRLADPFSLALARAIENREFDLEILSGDSFHERVLGHFREIRRKSPHNRIIDPATQDAVYLYAGLVTARAVMMVRHRPLQMRFNAPPEEVLFEVLCCIVHEYQHHLDIIPAEAKTQPVMFRIELLGHAREFLWRAGHGDPGPLKRLLRESPLGFALGFRDDFEKDYGPAFRSNLNSADGQARRPPGR